MSGHVLPLAGSSDDWHGGVVTAAASCILAPNPSPWTLDGTNTWVVGTTDVVVIDPGPADEDHVNAIHEHITARGQRVRGVLLTHGHVDHAEGARALARSSGVGVRALDAEHRLGSEGLGEGDVIDLGDVILRVTATPGHTRDSVSFVLPHDGSLLTGDTILGRGTSLVAWPDGTLADYLDSLRRLRDLVDDASLARILPGHGPVLDDPARVIDGYLAHRHSRLAEVRAIYESGITDPAGIVEIVYADVPREVWPAAELTVRAQVEFLTATGL